jgi:hypothetical protein
MVDLLGMKCWADQLGPLSSSPWSLVSKYIKNGMWAHNEVLEGIPEEVTFELKIKSYLRESTRAN